MKKCAICESKLNIWNRSRNCISCGISICLGCSDDGFHCLECYEKQGKKEKNKQWLFIFGIRYLLFIGALISASLAVYYLYPWLIYPFDIDLIIQQNGPTIIGLLLAFIFFLIGLFWYPLARKIMAKNNPNALLEEGRISAENKIKRTNLYYFIALALNSMMVYFALELRLFWLGHSNFWLDLITICALIFNIPILFSWAFTEDIIERTLISNLIIRGFWILINLLWVLTFAGPIYFLLVYGGIFQGQSHMIQISIDWHFWIYLSLFSILGLISFFRIVKREKREQSGRETESSRHRRRGKMYLTLKKNYFLGTGLLIGFIWFLFLVLAVFFIVGDYFMVQSFFSIPAAIGLVIPMLGISLIWLKDAIRMNNAFIHVRRELIMIALLIFSIWCIPLLSNPIYTHPDLDHQFSQYYGPDWANIEGDSRFEALPKSKYAFYNNLIIGQVLTTARFNVPYMNDTPSFILNNSAPNNHTFYFDAYLPHNANFGAKYATSGPLLPVIILLHGEFEDKGAWNANLTSQKLANYGFAVFDLNYGSIRTNQFGNNYTGYFISDIIRQIGTFTKYLAANKYEYRADLSQIYFMGRHMGGGLAMISGFGYNTTLAHLFSSELFVKGIISLYPVSDIGRSNTGWAESIRTEGYTILNGSSFPASPDYNEDWKIYNPIQYLNISTQLAPVFLITGTHDVLIPIRYTENFVSKMRENDRRIIYGKYLLGSDGFDGNHESPYGQSIIYYLSRYLFLNL